MTDLVPSAVLLPYQQAWMNDNARVRVAEKSRRIGWSWTCACESALEAARVDGTDTWYVGYNHDMALEFIRDVAAWARAFALIASEVEEAVFEDDDPDKHILVYTIHFASGHRVTALSSRPTNLRGKEGRVIIDEAAFHADLPGLLKAAIATKMWGGGARVDVVSTHNGTASAFNKLIEEVRAGKKPYSLHRCTLDDALAQGLYRRICLKNGWRYTPAGERAWRAELFAEYGDDADEELLCVPARSGGQYLMADLLERQMVDAPVRRLTLEDAFLHLDDAAKTARVQSWLDAEVAPLLARLPGDRLHYFGEDFGRVSDRTVLAPGYLAQDLTRKTPFVVELANVPYDQQRQVAFFLIDRLPNLIAGAMDATGNGGYLAEACAARYGRVLDPATKELVPKVRPITITDKWYAEALPPFRAALEDRRQEVARDADHLIDLCAFQVLNGLPKLPKTKTVSTTGGQPRHGDAGIAYVLAHYASRLPSAQYGYQPVEVAGRRANVLGDPAKIADVRGRRVAVTAGFKTGRGGIL